MSETYNGWKNYETWNVALWIDNDEGSQTHWRERALACWADAEEGETFSRMESATAALAEELKEDHEEGASGLALNGVYADLLGAALSEVDWWDVAESIYSGFEKTELDGGA